jgi:hypothetical protein
VLSRILTENYSTIHLGNHGSFLGQLGYTASRSAQSEIMLVDRCFDADPTGDLVVYQSLRILVQITRTRAHDFRVQVVYRVSDSKLGRVTYDAR